MKFTCPNNIKFECIKCGLCCGDTEQKTRRILLLQTEAQKIAAETSQPLISFSDKINDNQPYCFEMKKTSEGKCFFLKDNKCSIYEVRPIICVFYPFELKLPPNERKYVFDFTPECPGINQGKAFRLKDFEKLFEIARARLT